MELPSNVASWRCIAILGIVSRLTAGFGLLLDDRLPAQSGTNTGPGYTLAPDLQTLASSFANASESEPVTTDTLVPANRNSSSDTPPATTHPDHVLDAINVLQIYLANTKANTQAVAEPVPALTSMLPGDVFRTPETASGQDLESISNLLSQLNIGNAGSPYMNSISGSENNTSTSTVSRATDTVVLSDLFNTARNTQNRGTNFNSGTANGGGSPVQTLNTDTLANSGQTLTASVLTNVSSTPSSRLQPGGSDASVGANKQYVIINAELEQHFPQFNPQLFANQAPTQQHIFASRDGATRHEPNINRGTPRVIHKQQDSGNPSSFQGFNVGQPPEPNLETFQPLFGNDLQANDIPINAVTGKGGIEGPLMHPNSVREQTHRVRSNPVQHMSTNSEPNMNQHVNTINNQNNLVQIPQSVTYFRTPEGQLLRVVPYQEQQNVVPASSPYPQGYTPRVETSQKSGVNSEFGTRQVERINKRVPVSPREQPAVDPQNVHPQFRFPQMPYRNRMSNPYTLQRRRRIRPRQRYPYRMYPQRYQNIHQQPAYNTLTSRLYRPQYPEYPPLNQRGPESSSAPSNPGFRRVQVPVQARPGFTFNGVGQRSSDGALGVSSSTIPQAPQRPSAPLFQITSVNPVPPPRASSIDPQGSTLQQQFGMLGIEGQAMR